MSETPEFSYGNRDATEQNANPDQTAVGVDLDLEKRGKLKMHLWKKLGTVCLVCVAGGVGVVAGSALPRGGAGASVTCEGSQATLVGFTPDKVTVVCQDGGKPMLDSVNNGGNVVIGSKTLNPFASTGVNAERDGTSGIILTPTREDLEMTSATIVGSANVS